MSLQNSCTIKKTFKSCYYYDVNCKSICFIFMLSERRGSGESGPMTGLCILYLPTCTEPPARPWLPSTTSYARASLVLTKVSLLSMSEQQPCISSPKGWKVGELHIKIYLTRIIGPDRRTASLVYGNVSCSCLMGSTLQIFFLCKSMFECPSVHYSPFLTQQTQTAGRRQAGSLQSCQWVGGSHRQEEEVHGWRSTQPGRPGEEIHN